MIKLSLNFHNFSSFNVLLIYKISRKFSFRVIFSWLQLNVCLTFMWFAIFKTDSELHKTEYNNTINVSKSAILLLAFLFLSWILSKIFLLFDIPMNFSLSFKRKEKIYFHKLFLRNIQNITTNGVFKTNIIDRNKNK